MKSISLLLGLNLSLILTACAHQHLPTVEKVEVQKYLGTWYEIARFPHFFQEDCKDSKAEYSALERGRLKVLNSCQSISEEGKINKAEGVAKIVDKKTNAKLKVSFGPWLGWPFSGDYWILDLGPNYEYSLVGTPDRDYLWILSRQPKLSEQLLDQIVDKAKSLDFDVSKLIYNKDL